MKSQVNIFVLLILVTVSMILIHLVSNLIYGYRLEHEISDIQVIKMYNFLSNAIRAYSTLSLDYSAHQSFRESACFGGMTTKEGQGWAWICGGQFNPPDVNEVKKCNEKFIKYYLNVYYSNFSVNLPVNLNLNNFDSCKIGINGEDVFSGKYDNGSFWINCTGASFSIKGKNIYLVDNLNTSFYLTNNRFWYIYRKVWEWAKENYYGRCICDVTKKCGNCDTAKECAKEALRRLQSKFDSNVTCRLEESESCCEQETGPSCGIQDSCLPWPGHCQVTCHQSCGEPPAPEDVCIPENLVITKSNLPYYSTDQNTIYLQSLGRVPGTLECYSRIWNESRLARSDTYVCEDHKYYIPSSHGPVPLEFKIVVQASFRVPHPRCEKVVECECPSEAVDCYMCRSTGCTICMGPED